MKDIMKEIGVLLLIVAAYFGLICLFTKSMCVVFGITFTIWTAVFVAFAVIIFLALISRSYRGEDDDED